MFLLPHLPFVLFLLVCCPNGGFLVNRLFPHVGIPLPMAVVILNESKSHHERILYLAQYLSSLPPSLPLGTSLARSMATPFTTCSTLRKASLPPTSPRSKYSVFFKGCGRTCMVDRVDMETTTERTMQGGVVVRRAGGKVVGGGGGRAGGKAKRKDVKEENNYDDNRRGHSRGVELNAFALLVGRGRGGLSGEEHGVITPLASFGYGQQLSLLDTDLPCATPRHQTLGRRRQAC